MKQSKTERLAHLLNQLAALGFSYSEAQRLRRIELTLNRWATAECNGEIQRRESDDKPERISQAYINGQTNTRTAWLVPDREAGALKRLAAIMAAHPDLWSYRQGDPRGCGLYVGRKSDLETEENQIVRKARDWGFKSGSGFATAELEAGEFLRSKGASIPARNLLPLDQYYTRGTAVCA